MSSLNWGSGGWPLLPAILVILIDKAEVVFLGHNPEDMKQLAHFPNFYHILKILKILLMKDLKLHFVNLKKEKISGLNILTLSSF